MDSSSSIIKQMPVSVEAEQALLGSIIVNPDSFDKVGGMISAEDFYVEEHKHIFNALLKMYAQSKTIDVVTLVNALVENGDRDQAGGIQYISLIADNNHLTRLFLICIGLYQGFTLCYGTKSDFVVLFGK